MDRDIPFIDLFCGAGGLSLGFEQAGFRAVYANDWDKYACETYAYNHPQTCVVCEDAASINASQITARSQTSSIPLVVGGPNCQGVSLRGRRDPSDPKNMMFYRFRDLIAELQPEWFVMENVPGLLHRHNRELIQDIFHEFSSLGYDCGGEVLLAADYGVPQLRYRFLLIGNRIGVQPRFPNATFRGPDIPNRQLAFEFELTDRPLWRTVREAIGDLPAIENGGGADSMGYAPLAGCEISELAAYLRVGSQILYNHVCHKTPQHNIDLIRHIPQGKNWKSIPADLRPERFSRVALKDHTTTYGRLTWDMPSRTITTYFNNISAGAFTHPEQHRGISVREGARLQSFPDKFRFLGTLARQYRQVGNAVPPLLALSVARVIRTYMLNGGFDENTTHTPAVEYDRKLAFLAIHRPLQGMRFNLDKHLIRS